MLTDPLGGEREKNWREKDGCPELPAPHHPHLGAFLFPRFSTAVFCAAIPLKKKPPTTICVWGFASLVCTAAVDTCSISVHFETHSQITPFPVCVSQRVSLPSVPLFSFDQFVAIILVWRVNKSTHISLDTHKCLRHIIVHLALFLDQHAVTIFSDKDKTVYI